MAVSHVRKAVVIACHGLVDLIVIWLAVVLNIERALDLFIFYQLYDSLISTDLL